MSTAGAVSSKAVSILTWEDVGLERSSPDPPATLLVFLFLHNMASVRLGSINPHPRALAHALTLVSSLTLPFLNADTLMSAMKPPEIC